MDTAEKHVRSPSILLRAEKSERVLFVHGKIVSSLCTSRQAAFGNFSDRARFARLALIFPKDARKQREKSDRRENLNTAVVEIEKL